MLLLAIALASALTDLDAWTTGVIFPIAVASLLAVGAYVIKCLRAILREFQQTRREVVRITAALKTAGLLRDEDDDPDDPWGRNLT